MATKYIQAEEADRVMRELIDEFHTHLQGVDVRCYFRSDVATSKGKAVWAKVSKLPAVASAIVEPARGFEPAEPDSIYIIEIAKPVWDEFPDKRRALLDHELCHIIPTETGVTLTGHDVEEFRAVLERHGIWSDELADFARVLAEKEQPSLDLGAEADELPAKRRSISVKKLLSDGGYGPSPDLPA